MFYRRFENYKIILRENDENGRLAWLYSTLMMIYLIALITLGHYFHIQTTKYQSEKQQSDMSATSTRLNIIN